MNIIKRYKQILNTYNPSITISHRILTFFNFIKCYITDGASFNDFFGYRFPLLNKRGRGEYITLRRTRKLQNICNNPNAIEIFRDKIKFNQQYSELLGRKWLDVSTSSFSEFEDFLKSVGTKVFIKDVEGLCGIGVECKKVSDINSEELYTRLTTTPNTRFLLEQPIIQTGLLADLHPWSVNTIRITTILDKVGTQVYIMSAVLRIGTNHDHRDNLHAGGIAAHIDIPTGTIFLPGFNKQNQTFIYHPNTGIQLVGLKIPYWEECKKFIEEVAKKSSEVRYVGWDIVLNGDGTFVLIEGNDNGDHDVQQLHYRGLWPDYKKVIGL